jgi:pantetheine-phosphate adenylyltransferase
VCPGSFDPVTLGHVDIITRASHLFDKVFVAVMKNPVKSTSFTVEERIELLGRVISGLNITNVEVVGLDGLLVENAKKYGATAIVKGLRAVSDFEYEFQMALANKKLAPDIETVFLTTRGENMFLSSSVVKQIAYFGGDISGLVPDIIREEIKKRLIGKGVEF